MFQQDCFSVERKTAFSFMPRFYFRDSNGNTLAFLPRKAFAWKEEIRLFTDETLSLELLRIKASRITDTGVTFAVTDSVNHQKAGALQRSGSSWLVATEWTIHDANDQKIGKILERSIFLGRIFPALFPRSYVFEVQGQPVGMVREKPVLITPRMKTKADFSIDSSRMLDRRLATAAIVLMLAVEAAFER